MRHGDAMKLSGSALPPGLALALHCPTSMIMLHGEDKNVFWIGSSAADRRGGHGEAAWRQEGRACLPREQGQGWGQKAIGSRESGPSGFSVKHTKRGVREATGLVKGSWLQVQRRLGATAHAWVAGGAEACLRRLEAGVMGCNVRQENYVVSREVSIQEEGAASCKLRPPEWPDRRAAAMQLPLRC